MQNALSHHSEARPLRAKRFHTAILLAGGLLLLSVCIVLSMSFGAADTTPSLVLDAIFHYDAGDRNHLIIRELRLPRALGAALVGASFAVAGAIMQGMTRNPMADSSLLGLNAGGVLALACSLAFFPSLPYLYIVLLSFSGAAIGAILVFGLGSLSRKGLTPYRLVVSGAAVSALLTAISEGISLYYSIGQKVAFWFAGGVSNASWLQIKVIAPWVGIALLGACMLSRSVTLLSLGDEVASGLGQKTKLVKVVGILIVLALAGASVTVVGAVGFIGLVVPHITRFLVGVDYRHIIPCSAVIGAVLVVIADLIARVINPPYETPLGALIALIGIPFFLYLMRKERSGI